MPSELIFDIIQHPFFQRQRRIKQLGLTSYVYPGATHSRFQHVLGATFLMKQALQVLKDKGVNITDEEEEATLIAVLLHDIGHPPLSHSLEYVFVENVSHEEISLLFMGELDKAFDGRLKLGMEIFKGSYKRKFLHQLVSSQLDMDRLDYLRRDSFFTGVSEGVVGSDRIIKMLNTLEDELVVEEKGIYSVEKFLIARRLMYWQVYLHKTVVVAEQMLIKVLLRAKDLYAYGSDVFLTPTLKYFFDNKINSEKVLMESTGGLIPLEVYARLDDNDVFVSIKQWQYHDDFILSFLSKSIINRNLLKIELQEKPFSNTMLDRIRNLTMEKLNIEKKDINFIVFANSVRNNAYSEKKDEKINILSKNNELRDIAVASDVSNVAVLSQIVEKFFLCYPKDIQI
ncbi:MAG: HD domain-containing protein [Bacteroidota bacterium]